MKLSVAIAFLGVPSLLLSVASAADAKPPAAHAKTPPAATHASHPPATRAPTAMHATQVHSKSASAPGTATAARLPQLPRAATPAATHPAAPSAVRPTAKRAPKQPPKPPCVKEPISVTRGIEEDRFSLTMCDGSVAPDAVDHFSILARPGNVLRPAAPFALLAKVPGPDTAPGIKRVDARLVERLQNVVDHYTHGTVLPKVHVISGYRPTSTGSFHASARAVDFRLDGVTNEDLVAFCHSLPDTGCGYYPNSSFIHMDVRDPGAGHVSWIDASGPGESPRYVAAWPPPLHDATPHDEALKKLDQLLGDVPTDDHPADVAPTAEIPPPPDEPADPRSAANTTTDGSGAATQ